VLLHSFFQAQAARAVKEKVAIKNVELIIQKKTVVEDQLAKDIEALNDVVSNGWVS
jgi:hypothetical protein